LRARTLPPLDAAFVEWAIAFLADNSVVEYRGARAVSEAAPNTEWSFLQARAAINVGRPREALRVLDALGPDSGWTRGSDAYWLQRDRALHYLGEYEREVREMEEAQRRFPEFRLFIQSRVKGLAALGREREVNAEIDRAFTLTTTSEMAVQPMSQAVDELVSHGHDAAASRLAERLLDWLQRQPPAVQQQRVIFRVDLLMQLGRFREAREVALEVDAKYPPHVYRDAQHSLAYADAALGDLSTARRIAARANPQQWLNTLHRADMLALMGDSAGAVALLRDAFRENGDIRPIVHLYYGLRRLRGYAAYDQLLRPDDR
jgi:tetratricopeptide (TPR) repeat protein